jgi:hypothetical protein
MNKLFELSEETAQLVRYLQAFEKGTLVTYKDLKQILAKIEPRNGKLRYARYILERDHNAVWIAIKPRVGIRRLTDPEIASRLPEWWLNGARNKLKRGGHQSEIVELDALDINEQARFSVDCIQRELAFESLSKATRRKMERTARGTSNDLPAFTAIEWAISLSPRRKGPSAE